MRYNLLLIENGITVVPSSYGIDYAELCGKITKYASLLRFAKYMSDGDVLDYHTKENTFAVRIEAYN